MRGVLIVLPLALASCTLIDSVDGYAGPPLSTGGSTSSGGDAGFASDCTKDPDCDDSDPCTDDHCDGTICSHVPVETSDDNSCTDDACDPVSGNVTHTPKSFPAALRCASGTFTPCPEGYYGRLLSCEAGCDTAVCASFCVNSMVCEPACVAQVTACCGASLDNCPLACPAGYTPGSAFISPECACTNCTGCSVPSGPAVICTRN